MAGATLRLECHHHIDQMNRPDYQPPVLLLDLSGDERAARTWAAERFRDFQVINKADLKWQSRRQALTTIRQFAPHTFALFSGDLNFQSARGSMILFAALAGARHIIVGDRNGRIIERTRFAAFLIETPRLALEFPFGYLFVIPLSWLLTLSLSAALRFRRHLRSIRQQENQPSFITNQPVTTSTTPQTALYLRATLTGVSEGGMVTHIAGFASGARQLGHRLLFLVSGESQNLAPEGDFRYDIRPSSVLGATRAFFELWNNLLFTGASLSWLTKDDKREREIDFIYQRYSRFNWTGVALSVVTGLPLALEFNGSEVWVSQRWDPVGQLPLLKRFERLNLRAADRIFTVSEIERQNLIRAGVSASRVIANPNGVDVEKFRPDCGGPEVRRQLRRQLGIEEKIVVGFLGTFGPWHGAPVLAAAAVKVAVKNAVKAEVPCHFLFIGDGDERAATEEIFASRKGRATFVGRVSHDRVAAYLDACDVLASPHVASPDGSEFFGSPTKLFEYLATARPVVASRLGQIRDVIVDGENGLLVEPGDAEALAKAIERLAADEALRKRLGAAGRQTVADHFTWIQNAARVFTAMGRFCFKVRSPDS